MELWVSVKREDVNSFKIKPAIFFPFLTLQPPEEMCVFVFLADIHSATKVWLCFYIHSSSIIYLTLPYKVFIPHQHPLTCHAPKRQKLEPRLPRCVENVVHIPVKDLLSAAL